MYKFISFIALLCLCSCHSYKKIIDNPIIFDNEREILTKEYLLDRYGIDQNTTIITPKIIVLHWTAIPTLTASFNAFKDSKLPNHRAKISSASGLNVSSHFLVDQDGTIYRLMPETTMARHVIGLNHTAIGIENVGGTEETPMTRAQIKSNIFLVHYLSKKYDIDYLIGHYEYQNFEGHELWLEKDKGYRTVKSDPGERFMTAVRKGVSNINLKTTPKKQ